MLCCSFHGRISCIFQFCEILADLPEALSVLVAGGLDGGLLFPAVGVVFPALCRQVLLQAAEEAGLGPTLNRFYKWTATGIVTRPENAIGIVEVARQI